MAKTKQRKIILWGLDNFSSQIMSIKINIFTYY
jgi:hypothetical protein